MQNVGPGFLLSLLLSFLHRLGPPAAWYTEATAGSMLAFLIPKRTFLTYLKFYHQVGHVG